jgi:hypothetical protein
MAVPAEGASYTLERPKPGGITVIADLPGWWHAGTNPTGYSVDIDRTISHDGKSSARIKAVVPTPTGFGSLMQMSKADKFLGKRVRMSAWVRVENVVGSSGLWLRVDGQNQDPTDPLIIDTMRDRPIVGTRNWQRYEIVLDVAKEAHDIAFGAVLWGNGTLWVDEMRFEIVGNDVPVTAPKPLSLPAEPQNLSFDR